MKIGFIGLGLMGRPMAANLLAAGHELCFVVNRDRAAVAELTAKGAQECATPRDLADRCEAVVLCLPGSEVVERVVFGPAGLVEGTGKPLIIDCSTSQPQATVALAARLAQRGQPFVDAPVVRGPREAATRRLVALAGGEAADLAIAREVLSAFCEQVIALGAAGAGQQTKLVNNFLALGGLALIAEAHAVALRLGLDPARLGEAVSLGGGNSRVFQAVLPFITDRDTRRTQATLATALKDVSYYAEMAADAGGPDVFARQVRQLFSDAVQAGHGEQFLPHLLDHQRTSAA